MPYAREAPSYVLFTARSDTEIHFAVDFYFPRHTHQSFYIPLCDIPDDDYAAEQYVLQLLEAEFGSSDHGEHATLARLAEDIAQLVPSVRS